MVNKKIQLKLKIYRELVYNHSNATMISRKLRLNAGKVSYHINDMLNKCILKEVNQEHFEVRNAIRGLKQRPAVNTASKRYKSYKSGPNNENFELMLIKFDMIPKPGHADDFSNLKLNRNERVGGRVELPDALNSLYLNKNFVAHGDSYKVKLVDGQMAIEAMREYIIGDPFIGPNNSIHNFSFDVTGFSLTVLKISHS